jgi:hypothetical protein
LLSLIFYFLLCVLGNRNNEGGLVWGDEEVNQWWEHSTIKKVGGRRCNVMKKKEDWGLGRGELRRVRTDRTDRTAMTMWAEDGDGNGNNNADCCCHQDCFRQPSAPSL